MKHHLAVGHISLARANPLSAVTRDCQDVAAEPMNAIPIIRQPNRSGRR